MKSEYCEDVERRWVEREEELSVIYIKVIWHKTII